MMATTQRIAWLLAAVMLVGCAQRAPLAPPGEKSREAPVAPAAGGNPWAEPTRQVLIEHCGQCHLGNLPSANRRALAIYDLTETPWYARLRPGNYPGLTRRVDERGSEAQKATVARFVACARDGLCSAEAAPGR